MHGCVVCDVVFNAIYGIVCVVATVACVSFKRGVVEVCLFVCFVCVRYKEIVSSHSDRDNATCRSLAHLT